MPLLQSENDRFVVSLEGRRKASGQKRWNVSGYHHWLRLPVDRLVGAFVTGQLFPVRKHSMRSFLP